MSIQILPPEIQNQIAAGEVVERPASVVKECIENSIDAGATHIEIRIEEGGKHLIQITDNGSGMSPEDAEKSLLRHATSKIKSIDDLFSIQSYGFRGEALAAISSVSDFELVTKREQDPQGVSITEKNSLTPTPANNGTTIIIRNLFSPTPARLQYLKTNETEYRQCLKVIQSFALSNPAVSFKLYKDDSLTLDLPTSTQSDRILQILKKSSNQLIEVSNSQAYKLSGFTSAPGHYAGNRNHQYLFVNGRHIEDHKLSFAVREAYVQSCGIEKHLYPVFVLFIDIDPILVDVNVHPRKTEVKFAEPGEIFSLVKNTVISSLKTQNYPSSGGARGDAIFPKANSHTPKTSYKSSSTFNHALFQSAESFAQKHEERNQSNIPAHYDTFNNPDPTNHQPSATSPLTAITQIQNKYILAKSDEGLYLFDQHALHERLRFEKLYRQAQNKKIETQKLLIGQEVELSEDQISLIHENKNELEKLNFKINFPSDTIVEVVETPALLANEDFTQLFQDFVQYFESDQIGENIYERILRKILEYKSCRGSVFFGDEMKIGEMQQLLDEFQSTEWKLLCPHGRPNHVFWNYEEIDKMFHR